MGNNLICVGAGLVALDVVISSVSERPIEFYTGGSCGNVLTILSYMGWESFPIARLSNNAASELLIQDLKKWKVNQELLSFTDDGSTPIIIHRILKDKMGSFKHRFEFRNPEDGKYLPSYKPCLAKAVPEISQKGPIPKVFYFDRINRSSIELAKAYKTNGAIVFFEPSSMKDEKGFEECLGISDIVKFANDRIPDYHTQFPKGKVPLEVQTLGEEGLKFRRKGISHWTNVQGYSISAVVDAAGAGDWCTSGIISKLLSKHLPVSDLTDDEIVSSLKYGQILSALNCTFEGARGIMYSKPWHNLSRTVTTILNSNSTIISSSQSHSETKAEIPSTSIRISSLYSHAR